MSAKAEIIGTVASAGMATMFANGHLADLFFLLGGVTLGTIVAAFGGKAIGVDFGLTMRAKIVVHACTALAFGPLALNIAIKEFPEYDSGAIASAVGGAVAIFGALALIGAAKWTKKTTHQK